MRRRRNGAGSVQWFALCTLILLFMSVHWTAANHALGNVSTKDRQKAQYLLAEC
ncbi:hypothetical protein ACFL2Q_09545 [Thermodesulfobacteriota bacterium]